jgi:hypothetical protein
VLKLINNVSGNSNNVKIFFINNKKLETFGQQQPKAVLPFYEKLPFTKNYQLFASVHPVCCLFHQNNLHFKRMIKIRG